MRSSGCLAIVVVMLAGFALGSAAGQSTDSTSLLVKECDENALHVRVDSDPLRRLVGSQFRLLLEEGKSHVLIVVQDCQRLWMDGTDLGPARYTHIWVLIQGGQDVRGVFGAQQTRPTMTWFSLFTGSTSNREREVRGRSGFSPEAIERVSLGRPGSQSPGQVVVGAGMSYSWNVSVATTSTRLVGINHDVYSTDSAGKEFFRRIQALGNSIGGPADGTLHVVGGTDPRRIIGTGDYPVAVNTFVPIWVRTMLTAQRAK